MGKLFETRTIAERQVSGAIIKALLSLKKYLEDKSYIFIQDEINNESVLQITLVITDMEESNKENLILKIKELTGDEFLPEIEELILACEQAGLENFDNLTIFE